MAQSLGKPGVVRVIFFNKILPHNWTVGRGGGRPAGEKSRKIKELNRHLGKKPDTFVKNGPEPWKARSCARDIF